jgi:hypothetical protein
MKIDSTINDAIYLLERKSTGLSIAFMYDNIYSIQDWLALMYMVA